MTFTHLGRVLCFAIASSFGIGTTLALTVPKQKAKPTVVLDPNGKGVTIDGVFMPLNAGWKAKVNKDGSVTLMPPAKGPKTAKRTVVKRVPTASAEVPMRYVNGTVALSIPINGKPEWFLLDSGAPFSAVHTDLAAPNGPLVRSPASEVNSKVRLAWFPSIQIGESVLRNQKFYVHSSWFQIGNHFPQLGGRLAGILGYDILAKLRIAIDFQRQRAWVADTLPTAFVRGSDFRPLCPLDSAGEDAPRLSLLLEGWLIDAIFDTGSSPTVFTQEALKGVGDHVRFNHARSLQGVTGKLGGAICLADQISIGDVTWRSPSIFRMNPKWPTDSVLGLGFLVPFRRVVLDFPHKEIQVPAAIESIGFLELWLSQFGVFADTSGLRMPTGKIIAWKNLDSITGVPIHDFQTFNEFSAFDHPNLNLAKMEVDPYVAFREKGHVIRLPLKLMALIETER